MLRLPKFGSCSGNTKIVLADCKLKLREIVKELKISESRGARGVMVIVIGNGHGDTSSNPGQD